MTLTRLGWKSISRLATVVGGSVLLLSACNTGVEKQQAAPQVSAPAPAPEPAAPAVVPVVSINALMVTWIDNSAHVLWNAERPGRAPKKDADWLEIQEHATQLAAAGTLIQLGGTGQADPGWAKSPLWKTHAQAMADAAVEAINAAKSKNMEALVKANGKLVESCEGCHKQFKPELPTEGIKHHPPHER
jgi:cytochrome c'